MARARTARVIDVEMAADTFANEAHGSEGIEGDLLVLDRAPYPLDENVVEPATLSGD